MSRMKEVRDIQLPTKMPELVVPNGVDARTGGYFGPQRSVESWARHALGCFPAEQELTPLLRWVRQLKRGVRELVHRRSVDRLEEAGWGIIFPEDSDPALLREALSELLALRRAQANATETLYREFSGVNGLRKGESKEEFLKRHGSGAGATDPRKIPYYLLLVGNPDQIPFDFQYQLDVRHAVGRLHFEDFEDYFAYARKVVETETSTPKSEIRRLALFGPRNPDDWCTAETSRWLVRELGDQLSSLALRGWQVETYEHEHATKGRLTDLLGGPATPAILLCACHGLLYRDGDEFQRARQGALLCQEWAGPLRQGQVTKDCFLAAEDLCLEPDLPRGVVAFFFSCFGAATSMWDESDHRPVKGLKPRASVPFLAALPSRLLSQPTGGALAVIAHVDQAFPQYNGALQLETFIDLLSELMTGGTVGWAMELLNRRYAELASDFHTLREREARGIGAPVDREQLFALWTATNDSRGFVVLGDPAVRAASLPVVNGESR